MRGSRATGTRARVRHLTSVHQADDSRIFHRECRSLAAAGYDVTMIVGVEPEPDLDGVGVIGVGRATRRRHRATRTAWRVFRAARRERADLYHLHDPELLWVGLLLKFTGGRVVYDVHEDVPKQIMNKFWIPRRARRLIAEGARAAERVGAAVFDAVIAATPSIADRFPAGKTSVVQNFPTVRLVSGSPQKQAGVRHAFAYTGGLAEVQGVREVVAVAHLVAPLGGGVVAGAFDSDELEAEIVASEPWAAVRYLGDVTHAEAVAAVRSAHVGLVVNRPVSNYLDAYSTKMFEYMACGLPVVCSDFPLWRRIVTDAECGVAVDPLDPEAIARAVMHLAVNPEEAHRLGENGRRAVLERYNWEKEFGQLEEVYRRVLSSS